jgi:toxin-antitoxin system PIN domain toxin
MILPDVNPLIYAFRPGTAHHAVARQWLVSLLAGDSAFGLSPLVLVAVVRITTNRRVYAEPSTLGEAFEFCTYLRAHPNCRIVEPGERHWDIFERLCRETGTLGPRTTDAWFAALAIEWGCEWITFDRDFARFRGLRWRVPGPSDSV